MVVVVLVVVVEVEVKMEQQKIVSINRYGPAALIMLDVPSVNRCKISVE